MSSRALPLPRSLPLARALSLLLALPLLACSPSSPTPTDAGADGSSTSDTGPIDAVCARQHEEPLDGMTLVVCDEAFATAPFVHLPADSASGGVETVYGGIGHDAGGVGLIGRGRSITTPTAPAWADAEAQFGALRYAYMLYRATVRGGAVESVTPVVRVDDRVFARLLGGLVFEGGASPRTVDPGTGEVSFAFGDTSARLRVRFDAAPSDTESDHTAGFPRFALIGHIENFTHAVTSSTGGPCMPGLDTLGAGNPFFGHDGQLALLRYPGMHAPFDDVFTLAFDASGNVNMGSGLYVSPADLIQASAPTLTDATNAPHGTPSSGPSATLTAVDATMGGASCTP